MRKPSTFSIKNEDNLSDYSTSDPASTKAYLDDTISPQNSHNKESDDSDCFSDSSKKIRKKRNAYSKISDEIRLQLLECVKNGETLKSAAKRFKINYSSAKSILHTFRKEGRILKKSAQERTIKKKPDSMGELEATPIKSVGIAKKNSMQLSVKSGERGYNSKESTPAGSLTRLDEVYEQGNYNNYKLEEEQAHDESYMQKQRNMGYQDDHYNKMNYYMNYNDAMTQQQHHYNPHHEVGRDHMLTEGQESSHHYNMHGYGREFDTFNDMVSALNHRNHQVDEFFNDPSAGYLQHRGMIAHGDDKYFKNEHHGEYQGHEENGFNTLRSFMDTQSIFRDALKKANHVSYSNSNNTGFRKSSIDLF